MPINGSITMRDLEVCESKPPGIKFVEKLKGSTLSFRTYQVIVLIVTFLAYASFHATRKTASIVKGALDPQSQTTNLTFSSLNETWKFPGLHQEGWAPFDGPEGTALLGELDVAFLFVYAAGMFFAGHVGDRMDLRIFLTIGMMGTGLFTSLFGIGYFSGIHAFWYYLIIQMISGLFQSTGWPSVVAIVGHWFGKKKRGLIMGVWNAHTSVGNITGSVVASVLLKYGWGWSMIAPGVMIACMGLVVLISLPLSPDVVGVSEDESEIMFGPEKEWEGVQEPLLISRSIERGKTSPRLMRAGSSILKQPAVGFITAWKIPGVAPYALCLFFAKLVAYTFLYWLPFYITQTAIGGRYLSNEESGNLSTLFDVGGVVGGVVAGFVSDYLNARAITAASFMYCAIPALFLYRSYGHASMTINIILMFVTGVFVNGPYALITTAVSADLGTHSSLRGNSRALATVTAIIDGTGSIGAALGPLMTGYISAISWNAVFTMLMAAALVAGLLLTKLVMAEVAEKIRGPEEQGSSRSIASINEV